MRGKKRGQCPARAIPDRDEITMAYFHRRLQRGVSMELVDLPERVYRMDEAGSSDQTGKYLLSPLLTQTLPLNHRLGLKTRGLCKRIACFQFEASNSFFSTKRLWVFFFPCDSQTWSLPGTGTASSSSWDWGKQSKNHHWETGAKMPHPVSACTPVGLRSRGFGVFLWASTVLHAQRCRSQQQPPGAVASREPRDAAQPLKAKFSLMFDLGKQTKGREKSYPVTHSQGSQAMPPRVCWFARPAGSTARASRDRRSWGPRALTHPCR